MTDIRLSSTQLECENVRVNFAYNFNTISWINRKLNTMNKLLNHIAQVFGWILQTLFPQVPERFFAHSVAQCGCDIPSIRRVTHRKPPFYFSSTKRFSCNGLSTDPLPKPCTSKIRSSWRNWYSTRDKKRSPSKEQLMQYKSFKVLRIANSGLQPVKELLKSVQITKELWRLDRHSDYRTTHHVE